MSTIHVDEAALNSLKNALETAGQEYKSNLAKLTNLIEEITSGDIQGDPANDLLAKFKAKQDTLNKITSTIEEAEEYMGLQTNKFGTMIGDLKSGMK
jgi:predicted  nucleic acid-binding Zn-ribbon protein